VTNIQDLQDFIDNTQTHKGDEFHLLFVCCNAYLVNLRRIYLPRYYVTYPSIVKMNGPLSFCNVEVY
jgi:hypothetical protein